MLAAYLILGPFCWLTELVTCVYRRGKYPLLFTLSAAIWGNQGGPRGQECHHVRNLLLSQGQERTKTGGRILSYCCTAAAIRRKASNWTREASLSNRPQPAKSAPNKKSCFVFDTRYNLGLMKVVGRPPGRPPQAKVCAPMQPKFYTARGVAAAARPRYSPGPLGRVWAKRGIYNTIFTALLAKNVLCNWGCLPSAQFCLPDVALTHQPIPFPLRRSTGRNNSDEVICSSIVRRVRAKYAMPADWLLSMA